MFDIDAGNVPATQGKQVPPWSLSSDYPGMLKAAKLALTKVSEGMEEAREIMAAIAKYGVRVMGTHGNPYVTNVYMSFLASTCR